MLLAVLLAAACDESFQPIDNTGRPFSIFGYLDASADTQFIRINQVRALLQSPRQPTGIVATIENLRTGTLIQLRDSATEYVDVTGDTLVYAHNFWTTEPIEAGTTYRLAVQAPNGGTAGGVVRIPRDYLPEVWPRLVLNPVTGDSVLAATLYIKEPPPVVAFLILETWYWNRCQAGYWDQSQEPPRMLRKVSGGHGILVPTAPPDGAMALLMEPSVPVPDVPPECGDSVLITKRMLRIVASQDEWATDTDHSTWQLHGDQSSKLTNSLGFLGGVLTKWIRIEHCELIRASSSSDRCRLRYDSTTATLRGTVAGTWCPPRPDTIIVELRELESGSSEPLRIRKAYHTDPAGNFEVGALRPGIQHLLTVFVGDTLVLPRPYNAYHDTLTFTAGQTMTYPVDLRQVGPCPGW